MMKDIGILLFLCVFLGPSSWAQVEITEEMLTQQRHLVEGNKFLLLEEYDNASKAFNKLFELDEENAAAFWGISRVHLGRKNWDEAEKAIKQAIEIEPDNKWYYEHYATILKKNRDGAGLVQVYTQLRKLEPDQEEYAFKLVKYLEQQKEYKRGIKVLEELESDDIRPEVSYRKARIHDLSGAQKKAEKEYKKMVTAFPNEMRYRHLLASHYQANRADQKAMQVYKEILEIDPDDSRAALAISNQNRNSGQDLKYLESIEKVLASPDVDIDVKVKELIPFVQKLQNDQDPILAMQLKLSSERLAQAHPDEAKAFALKGDIHNLLEEKDPALEAYSTAIELNPSVYLVWEQYLFLLVEKANPKEFEEKVNEALDYFPNRGRLHFFSATALTLQGKWKKADEVLSTAQYMAGRDIRLKFDLLFLFAQIKSEIGSYQEATRLFEETLAINDKSTDVKTAYALHLAHTHSNLEKAKNLIEEARTNSPDNPNITLALAVLENSKGNPSEAKELLSPLMTSDANARMLEDYGDILFRNNEIEEAVTFWEKALEAGGFMIRLQKKIQERKINPKGI